MWDWIQKLMGSGGGGAQGSNPAFAGMTGTPDGVGPVQGGINVPLGDYTEDQLKGMQKDKKSPFDMFGGSEVGLSQAKPRELPATSIEGLMQMAMANQNKPRERQGGRNNPYVQGLMGRGR